MVMLTIKSIRDVDVRDKKVFVRVDIDVDPNTNVSDIRLQSMASTIRYLLENSVGHIFLAGHMGRPNEGGELRSTASILPDLEILLSQKIKFGSELEDGIKINLLENLRISKEEEENNEDFTRQLASLADIYVNESFATSHRSHASIVGVPKLIPGYMGLHLAAEITTLTKVLENPDRPLVTLISGIKEDKVEMIGKLRDMSDKVLIAGRLPEYVDPDYGKSPGKPEYMRDPKVIIAKLTQDREDVTIRTMELFEEEIGKARTIILAGVISKYEDEGHRQGTKRIFEAVANSSAFKIVGGGDSLAAINMFNIADKFNWISVGGGAMLEFLIHKTLPGLEALQK